MPQKMTIGEKVLFFDIEADGLLDTVTKIHCLSYAFKEGDQWHKGSITKVEDMAHFMSQFEYFVGQNIIDYDLPCIEKFTGFKVDYKRCRDTMALSMWIFPNRKSHSLESWGDDVGVDKVEILDWDNLPIEDYIIRCETDVEITRRLYITILRKMYEIYGNDQESVFKAIEYASFKMYCIYMQTLSPFLLDIKKTTRVYNRMINLLEAKRNDLRDVMPPDIKWGVKTKPLSLYKKDGSVSVAGQKWFDLLMENNLPIDHNEPVKIIVKTNPANPASVHQIKNWLFSIGWKPATFKYVKDENTGGTRAVPQINNAKKELCESILLLKEQHPTVEELEGAFVLKSRSDDLAGFLKNVKEDGHIVASAHGLTNTMRLKHTVLVNLPGVTGKNDIGDGVWIRGCLLADEGKELCGADVSSLEDSTKQHYIWPYDPDYVNEMKQADYDPHISIGILAGLITKEEAAFYKENNGKEGLSLEDSKKIKEIGMKRRMSKIVNFSGVYGIGAKALSLGLGIPMTEAKTLIDAYWVKNWSVKKFSSEQFIRNYNDEMWVYNPVSKFYYNLRFEKDIFATLNSSTGVFVFDTWVKKILEKRPQITAQFHDEVVLMVEKNRRKQCHKMLQKCMDEVNNELQLNVTIKMEDAYGNNYAEVH